MFVYLSFLEIQWESQWSELNSLRGERMKNGQVRDLLARNISENFTPNYLSYLINETRQMAILQREFFAFSLG